MTRDEILNMEGTEIRLAVAKYIMGWKRITVGEVGWWVQETEKGTFYKCMIETKNWIPDEDIRVTFEVVGKMIKKGFSFYFEIKENTQPLAMFYSKSIKFFSACAEADIAPLAICRAALLAFEKSDDE